MRPTRAFPMLAAMILGLGGAARADEPFPSRPITMIVPFAAGGSSDVIARIVGEELGKVLGQRIVHENVAGAGGTVGLARLAAAKPDGYTIAQGNAGTNASTYSLYPDLKYKPDAFAPIAMVARTSSLIALKKDFPAKTMAEFQAYAKANPGAVRLGHAGVGSNNYIICRSFIQAAKVEVTLVSYRGGSPALNDAMGGHIDGVCDSASSATPALISGHVRGLVLAAPARLPTLPDLPTATEAGVPEFQAGGWNALFAPAATPAPLIDALNAAARKAIASDIIKSRYGDLGVFIPTDAELTPKFLAAHVADEIEKHRKLLDTK